MLMTRLGRRYGGERGAGVSIRTTFQTKAL